MNGREQAEERTGRQKRHKSCKGQGAQKTERRRGIKRAGEKRLFLFVPPIRKGERAAVCKKNCS